MFTKDMKDEIILLTTGLIDELGIEGEAYNHINELISFIEGYNGTFIDGFRTTVSLLLDGFPVIECDEVRMKTERFINRLNMFINHI